MNYAHEKHLILETKLQAVEGPFILRGLSWFQRTWWNRKGAYWETCGQSRREQKIHLAINGDNLVQKSWLTYCFETGSQVAQSWPCAPSVASFLPPFLQCWGYMCSPPRSASVARGIKSRAPRVLGKHSVHRATPAAQGKSSGQNFGSFWRQFSVHSEDIHFVLLCGASLQLWRGGRLLHQYLVLLQLKYLGPCNWVLCLHRQSEGVR